MHTLVLSALFALASAGIYAYVGSQIAGRQVSADARLASALFAAWWYGLAGAGFIGAILNLSAAAGYTDVNLWLTFGLFNLLLICGALGGLLFYLIYLYTGSRKALAPLAVFYILLYLCLVYLVNLNTPIGVDVERWRAQIRYEQEFNPVYGYLLVVLLLVPQIVAAIAYFSLFFRATDLTQRYRIALVSGSIVVWFGASILVTFLGGQAASQSDAWQVGSRLLSLLATLVILLAYKPPRSWKRRFGLRSLDEPAPAEVTRATPSP